MKTLQNIAGFLVDRYNNTPGFLHVIIVLTFLWIGIDLWPVRSEFKAEPKAPLMPVHGKFFVFVRELADFIFWGRDLKVVIARYKPRHASKKIKN